GRAGTGRGEGPATARRVRAGAEDRVGETDGARLRPGDVFAEGRPNAEEVRSARVGGTDAHRLVGPCDTSLLLRKCRRDPELLPLGEIRSQGIHGRGHRDPRALREVLEKLETRV